MPTRYAIVIEKTRTGYSAFVPDLPGCIATGDCKTEVKHEMKTAIRFHIDGLMEDGLPVPKATSSAQYVEA
jgi:predicted RNase H-like HicB family nuclease